MKTKFLTIIILTLFSIATTAQQSMKNYTSEWKKIDSLIQKQGQTKSALTAINSIYTAAIKEKNDPQIIKTLIYQTSLEENITENNLAGTIQKLEKQTLNEPAHSILNSIIAEKYWRYFQQNRWKFYNRTAAASFQKDDPETWSAEDFHAAISKHYLASVRNEKQLQNTRLSAYDAILIKGNTRTLRPTLFDLLAHRALNYFKNDERSITKPAYSFTLNNDSAFASADIFTKAHFDTQDTISLYYQAILLYQKLLNFHATDVNKEALIDVDIDRLEFVNAHALMPDKQNKYEAALKHITDKYNDLPAASQAWYLQAALHAEKARNYQPLINETNRYEWVKAKEICDKIITQKDSSEGKTNAINLLNQITQEGISLEIEKVNLPGQPFRALVGFRNFTKLYFRVVNIDKKTKDAINEKDQDDYWKSLLSLPVLKKFEQQFPDTKDHQAHTAEIKIDALPVGQYAVIASTSPDFALNKNPLAVHYLYISNIAWIKKSNDYFVLHRETGQPLNRASVQLWYTAYDYNTRKSQERKGENLMTDKNGFFRIAPSPGNKERTYRLEIATADDRLFMDDIMYNNYQPVNTLEEREKKTSFLFSDRSIYRPGQTVYFKGIMVTRDPSTKTSAIASGIKTTVILYDANQQKIDSVTVTTNEYGSYSGKMILPSSVLNGRFRLADKVTNGSINLSVEEYKRPKFEVSLSAPKGTYKVNDSITVGGLATAYAGNTLNDATVKYRVVRRTFYPMWHYGGFRKMIWPPVPQEEVEITNGQTSTDAGGNFNVVFKAVPDLSQDKKNQPVFSYSV
ncbi:MAG TPA: MG2 domain-containing protein, partial [Flavitalea sp.]|nr:MG2 domain-containing protein [Flavitalea sp.]